jgi:glucose-6-phosphate dehydrogenase assembly protein OpcA
VSIAAPAVDSGSIEKALAALFEEAVDQAAGGPPITRACRLNLVIGCRGRDQARQAEAAVAAIAEECPSRALLAVIDDRAGDAVTAEVTAHCAPGGGEGRHVCCEQVTITGSGRGAARLPDVVLPLLLPGLPVAVWLPGDPDLEGAGAPAAVARGLVEMADRLVVDARFLREPLDTLARLFARPVTLGDLGWQRLRGWREMTAAFFDGQAFESHPARVTRIRATYAGPMDVGGAGAAAGAGEAILLSCWAASRLGWKPASGPPARTTGRLALERPHAAGPGTIEIMGTPSADPTGRVLSFEMEAGDALFRLERSGVLDCVTATVTLPEACPIPRSARVPERDEASLLCRALEPGADGVHHETLALLARLAGAPQGG